MFVTLDISYALKISTSCSLSIKSNSVHKCGGTSIQGAMYKRARSMRNTDFHIHSQILNMKAEVQTYKHSYGGGTKEKKLIWDAKRSAHIDSIAQSQSRPKETIQYLQ